MAHCLLPYSGKSGGQGRVSPNSPRGAGGINSIAMDQRPAPERVTQPLPNTAGRVDAATASGALTHEALEPTRDAGWVLRHEGLSVLSESAVKSRFAFGNGFLGMRASRALGRGPTWISWMGYSRWASWPRCYVAGLFDVPDTDPPMPALVPVADWSRLRIDLDGEPAVARTGETLRAMRMLDMRRGALLSSWAHRTPAGILVEGQGLRLLSLADRATGMQLYRFWLDRDDVEVMLDASFAMAGLGMEPVLLEQDIGSWRTETTDKGVAMAGATRLRLDGTTLAAERPFPLHWVWRWRSVAGQVVELVRQIAVARADTLQDDPVPAAGAALARSRALGWRRALAAHEEAWKARWEAGGISIEGDEALQHALRFAVYHLTSAANPEDERVSIGARALTGDAYLGHVFWDTEIYLLPFYTTVWPQAARALLMYRYPYAAGRARQGRSASAAGARSTPGSRRTPATETTPERAVADRRHGGASPQRQAGAPHQRRRCLCRVAILARDAATMRSFSTPAPRSCWRRRGSGRAGP